MGQGACTEAFLNQQKSVEVRPMWHKTKLIDQKHILPIEKHGGGSIMLWRD